MTFPFARAGAVVLAVCAASAVTAQDVTDAKTFATMAASSEARW